MFMHFYGSKAVNDMALNFQRAVSSLNVDVSPAQIQGHLLLFKESPQAAVDNVARIIAS